MWPSARPCLLLLGTFFALGCRDPLRPAESAPLRAGFAALAQARQPAPLSAEALGRVEGLRTALARGLDQTGASLAAQAVSGDATAVRVSVIAEATTLDPDGVVLGQRTDRMAILLNENGDFALNHALSWSLHADGDGEAGRRCWGVGGRWWVADAQGPLTEVPVLADEHLACARAPSEVLTAPLLAWLDLTEVVSARALASKGPDAEAAGDGLAGRPSIEVVVRARAGSKATGGRGSLSETPAVPSRFDEAPAAPDLASPAPLAAHTHLVALEGRLRFEPESGALVDAALTVSAAFRKGPKVGRLNLSVRLRTDVVDQAIIAPEGALLAGPRPRIYQDLKTILGADQGEVPPATDGGVVLDLPAPGTAPTLELEAVGEGPLPAAPQVDDEPLVPTAPAASAAPPTPALAEARFDIAPETADPAAEMSPHEDLP